MSKPKDIYVEYMRELINKKSEELYEEAYELVSIFHDRKRQYILDSKKISDPYREPRLTCRVTKNNKSPGITIEWGRVKYIGDKGQRSARTSYIKKGKKQQYRASAVIAWDTLAYEEELFEFLEPQFAKIRERSILIGKLSRALSFYEKGIGRYFDKYGQC